MLELGKLLRKLRLRRLCRGKSRLRLGKSLFIARAFLGGQIRVLQRIVQLPDLRIETVDRALRLRDAVRELRTHFVQRGIGRSGGVLIALSEVLDQPVRRILVGRVGAGERAGHSAAQRVKLRFARVQLLFALGKILRAGAELLLALLVFLLAVLILGKSLFILGGGFLVFGKPVLVFLLAVDQLLIGVIQFCARVRKLLLPVAVVAPAIIQLPARVAQFFLRVAELFVGLGLRVIELTLRIVELFRRLVDKIIVAQLRACVAERLQLIDDGVDIVVIVAVKRGHLRRAGDTHIGRRVVVERERLARQVQIRLDRAAAERRRAALHRKIHGRAHRADDRICILGQRVGEIVPRRQGDAIANFNVHQREHVFLHHALVRALGHAPAAQQHLIDAAAREGEDLDHRVERVGRGKRVDDVLALGILDLVLRAQCGNILIGQAKGRKHLNVG